MSAQGSTHVLSGIALQHDHDEWVPGLPPLSFERILSVIVPSSSAVILASLHGQLGAYVAYMKPFDLVMTVNCFFAQKILYHMDQANILYVHDFFAVVKVFHFIDGVKVLNFLANLDFDWKLLRRKPAPTWPSIVYLAERLARYLRYHPSYISLKPTSPAHQAWISTAFAFPLIELELALILIVVRVLMTWFTKHRDMETFKPDYLAYIDDALNAFGCLHLPFVDLSSIIDRTLKLDILITVLTGIRAIWHTGPEYHGCVIFAPRANLLSMSIVTIAAYAILLVAMLAGLLRQGQARSFGISPLLFQQGCIWFALAVVAEVPTLALVLANVNRSIHLLLQVPRVMIASIGTTTMFRVLHNYAEKQGVRRRVWLGPNSMAMASTGSLSPPLTDNDLKVSVTSTTAQFNDDATPVGANQECLVPVTGYWCLLCSPASELAAAYSEWGYFTIRLLSLLMDTLAIPHWPPYFLQQRPSGCCESSETA
ncbi:hypothetical protein BJV78DRAFT_1289315 [Lactifluus subvellereus]|nr:hypothetical protein BJV78DRAFT_1289315 [Lactifluus subvellereus]